MSNFIKAVDEGLGRAVNGILDEGLGIPALGRFLGRCANVAKSKVAGIGFSQDGIIGSFASMFSLGGGTEAAVEQEPAKPGRSGRQAEMPMNVASCSKYDVSCGVLGELSAQQWDVQRVAVRGTGMGNNVG